MTSLSILDKNVDFNVGVLVFCKYMKNKPEEHMKDFINHIAYIISESGDAPSYDDIYTLCKQLGKEPDENTMTREEYNSLSDEEKEEIHKTAMLNVDFDDLDPDIDSEKYWKKFNDWSRKSDQLAAKYDDEGLPVDPDERKRFLDGKKAKKRKESGVVNAFLFVMEECRVFSNKKYDWGPGGTDDNGARVSG